MKSSRNKVLEQMRKDKGLILFCLLLAFFGWQGIRRNIGFEVSVSNIAIDIDVPEGWAVWEKSMNRVNILFRGSREAVRYLNNEQLRVIIPVTNPVRGEERTIKLSEKFLRNPTEAKVVRFSPSEVVIRLDQETQRLLPVKANITGSPANGFEVDRVVCNPATVRVTGARQVLDGMDYVQTDPIELKDRQTSFKESVPIALPLVDRMIADPDWVSVEIQMDTHNRTETLEDVPLQILSAPGEQRNIIVAPNTIHVTIEGQERQIETINKSAIFAYVNCLTLIESTSYELPVQIQLPAGVRVVKMEPSIVHVEIRNHK